MRGRAYFENMVDVVAAIKVATIKNKDRKKDFLKAGLPSPPHRVTTRWPTWLKAALYCNGYFPAICSVASNCTGGGLLAE